jgi:hypothetical protein
MFEEVHFPAAGTVIVNVSKIPGTCGHRIVAVLRHKSINQQTVTNLYLFSHHQHISTEFVDVLIDYVVS